MLYSSASCVPHQMQALILFRFLSSSRNWELLSLAVLSLYFPSAQTDNQKSVSDRQQMVQITFRTLLIFLPTVISYIRWKTNSRYSRHNSLPASIRRMLTVSEGLWKICVHVSFKLEQLVGFRGLFPSFTSLIFLSQRNRVSTWARVTWWNIYFIQNFNLRPKN